ncbi:diaminopimelate epimerase [Tepidamorphus sp. 3E244]|uniref:diaminopimelate epimerase n=1 Tax=Tepidamorphus sp. 3E244 TaxID=3385498 RepID=UPI0038FCF64B
MTTRDIAFRKMNGLGNDFIIVDARTGPLGLMPPDIARIANRETGIGCDQFIALLPGKNGADVFMRIFNPDGSEAGACGNATRCVADILGSETGKRDIVIETIAGQLPSVIHADGTVSVDMGAPRLKWDEIPLAEEFHDTSGIELQVGPIDAPVLHSPAVANMGNPHAVFFTADIDAHDLAAIGPVLENHPMFPERANISIVQVIDRTHVRARVWERSAGLTLACGSAACAIGVSAVRRRMTERKLTVTLPGGPLLIEWRESDGHVIMTGPVTHDYDALIPHTLLPETAA